MSESQSPSAKTLPPHPNLNWLKNRAKERLAKLRAATPTAKLALAQLAIARDYGFSSWRKLKEAVELKRALTDGASTSDETHRQELLAQYRRAVNAGDAAEVRRLLDTEPYVRQNLNAPIFAFDGRAILHAKEPAMVDLLLEYGADINAKSSWWAGPWGVLDNAEEKRGEFLISRGAEVDVFAAANLNKLDRLRELLDADPSLVQARGGDGCRPLHFAKSREAINFLLERGADINARDVDHESTAAQWAIVQPMRHLREVSVKALDRVRYLLRRGAEPDVFMAAAINDVSLLRGILNANPDLMDITVGSKDYAACPDAPGRHIYVYTLAEGKTAMQVAADFDSKDCLQFMLSRANKKQRFLLACSTADAGLARSVLAENPNIVAELTPQEQHALTDAAFRGNAAAVKLMLDLGFDPLTPGSDTGTALHCAAWQGQAEVVRVILAHPVALNLVDRLVNAIEPTHKGRPLGWCIHGSTNCRNPRGDYPAVAKMLMDVGAIGGNAADADPAVRAVLEQN
jgi:ankyrin repeat protein